MTEKAGFGLRHGFQLGKKKLVKTGFLSRDKVGGKVAVRLSRPRIWVAARPGLWAMSRQESSRLAATECQCTRQLTACQIMACFNPFLNSFIFNPFFSFVFSSF